MWKSGCNNGRGLKPETKLHSIRPSSKEGELSGKEKSSRLFPMIWIISKLMYILYLKLYINHFSCLPLRLSLPTLFSLASFIFILIDLNRWDLRLILHHLRLVDPCQDILWRLAFEKDPKLPYLFQLLLLHHLSQSILPNLFECIDF